MTKHGSIYRMFQEESAILLENDSCCELRGYYQKCLYQMLNGYGGDDETSFKEC